LNGKTIPDGNADWHELIAGFAQSAIKKEQ
jgi:hypothetical protein